MTLLPPFQFTGEKNPHATALGTMGGVKGGPERAAALRAVE
jgi:hypothetical protein